MERRPARSQGAAPITGRPKSSWQKDLIARLVSLGITRATDEAGLIRARLLVAQA